jgi:D-alanyl-D-alanine carboxypeptidase
VAASASERKLLRLWDRLGIPADYASARQLRWQHLPRKLVRVGRSPAGRTIRLTPRAAVAWRRLESAAKADGITLLPISGFRSVPRQAALIRRKLSGGAPIARILRVMAAPGCSEHHTGRALDLGCPGCDDLTTGFGRTRAFRWLRRKAGRFGFHLSYPRGNAHGISYEPWHWCWRAGT